MRYKFAVPTVHREDGFVFYFYAEEGNEPAHVHVDKGDGTAKLWLNPLRLAWVEGFKVQEIRHVLRIAERERVKLVEEWNEFFERKS